MKIEVVHLRKHFANTKAVDDISFTFNSGDIIGFVGPNGAGKTTTMRIMATLDEPTDGDVFFDDVSVVESPERVRELMGYVPESLPGHREMTVHEYLDFFARAYGVRGDQRRKVVEDIEEFTNLLGIRDKFLNDLSKGMGQRVCLARALVHDPQVLIMDEPASGLDPRARVELRELLKIMASQGKAILISSHILTELAEICTGSVIIERGKLLKAGTLQDITKEECTHHKAIIRPLSNPEDLYKALLEMPGISAARLLGNEVQVDIEGNEAKGSEVLTELVKRGFRLAEFRQRPHDLESVFMNVTKGDVQ